MERGEDMEVDLENPKDIDGLPADQHTAIRLSATHLQTITLEGCSINDYHLELNKFPSELWKAVVDFKVKEETCLFVASRTGAAELVAFLLRACRADWALTCYYTYEKTKHCVQPVWVAAVLDELQVLKELVVFGADYEAPSDSGSTALRSACYCGHTDVVRFLIEQGADVNRRNVYKSPPIINASPFPELCRVLIQHDVDVNGADANGWTALHYAAHQNHGDSTRLLLESGADWRLLDSMADDPLRLAGLEGNTQIVHLFLELAEIPLKRRAETLMLLGCAKAKYQDPGEMEQLWKEAAALMRLYPEARLEPVPDCHPGSLGIPDPVSDEEVHDLIHHDENRRMFCLLVLERILGFSHEHLLDAYTYACARLADLGQCHLAFALQMHAFDGTLPLHEAMTSDTVTQLEMLTSLCCELFSQNTDNPPVEAVVQVLGRAYENIRVMMEMAFIRPVHERVAKEAEDVVRMLMHLARLLCDAPHKVVDDERMRTVLCRTLRFLVERREVSCKGWTVLHIATDSDCQVLDRLRTLCRVTFPSPVLLQLLVGLGADVCAQDDDGDTPLHLLGKSLSLSSEQKASVRALLEVGAHYDAVNKANETPKLKFYLSKTDLFQLSTLKCAAARVCCTHPEILSSCGTLPPEVSRVLNLHRVSASSS